MTGSIWHLVLAVMVFLAAHSITNLAPVRGPLLRRLGKHGFYGATSVVSTLLLVWAVAAYLAAPTVVLWAQQPWMRWVPVVTMAVACQLLAVGMTTRNPFSIGPGGAGFDPRRPGVLRLTRHPVVWALGLWAGAHIVPNGDVAALLLFAPLVVLSLAGPRVLDAKRRRSLGDEAWARLASFTDEPCSVAPAVMLREIGPWRLVLGLALFAALLLLHEPVIGVTPLP